MITKLYNMYLNLHLKVDAIKRNIMTKDEVNLILGKNIIYGKNVRFIKYVKGLHTTLRIGDDVQLMDNVIIDCSGHVSIGENSCICDDSMVLSHRHIHERGSDIFKFKEKIEHTHIGKNVLVYSKALILSGADIKDNSIIGALTKVK